MAKVVKVFFGDCANDVQYKIDKYVDETKYVPLQVAVSVSTQMTDRSYYIPQELHTVAIIFETDISIEM